MFNNKEEINSKVQILDSNGEKKKERSKKKKIPSSPTTCTTYLESIITRIRKRENMNITFHINSFRGTYDNYERDPLRGGAYLN